jgi:hypothetical protein
LTAALQPHGAGLPRLNYAAHHCVELPHAGKVERHVFVRAAVKKILNTKSVFTVVRTGDLSKTKEFQ